MNALCPSLERTKWEALIELAANLRDELLRACAGRPGHRYSLSPKYRTHRGMALTTHLQTSLLTNY